ncbi:family 78 glycoside hydrolase catalytic domain [Sphingobacterium sp. LRF_L2]|uniref:family 78 glycoside hydrolase catalytic domain n=1 Tax=Sphingobacterium sp. LRF_L2 TaxID=3369421 RepID=UPI003F6007F6
MNKNSIVFFLFLTHSILLGPHVALAAMPGSPFHLRTSDKIHPVGTDNTPYFGWHIKDDDENEIQSAYQLLVSEEPTSLTEHQAKQWNSGKVISRKQNYVYYGGKALDAGKRYYWKVRTWDKDGQVGAWSETHHFDTGLLTNVDWKGAHWIKRDNDEANDYTYFRKQATLKDKPIKRAIAYISAYHSYSLYINGEAVGKGAAFHYPQYAYYKGYDVTTKLKNGANSIASMTHWYGGGQGRPKGERGFILKLIVDYTDGTQTVIGTDETWRQHAVDHILPGTKRRNGEGIGFIDIIDSRKTIENWQSTQFNDNDWKNAKLIGAQPSASFNGILQPDLTDLKEQEITPVSVKKIGSGSYIIDLGKIYAGVPQISFEGGNAGDTVQMRGGFVLEPTGEVSKKMNQSTDLSYQFILNGNKATFQPVVYLGYRYLQVDHSPIELNVANVHFITRHFELEPEQASFTSSNSMLNEVWALMQHSLVLGAQESFVDTPTREKGAFLGDAWSQSVVTMSCMGERALTLRTLLEFLDSQDQYWSEEGALNSVYPNVDGKRDIPDYTQQYLIWVWDYFLQTGNLDFLHDNYKKLRKVAMYVSNCQNETTGLIHHLKGGSGAYKYGIIDWPAVMRFGYDMNTEARTVINAYAYADFDIMSKIAHVVGNKEDQSFFHTKAIQLKDAFNRLLLQEDGLYIDGLLENNQQSLHISQHANMLPLALNMTPATSVEKVTAQVKEGKMSVGMVTVRFLLEALGEQKEGPHLLELLTNPNWNGWAQTVSKGGTATWESWDADQRNESMCHPWGAVGLMGIQRYVLGIKPLSAQHDQIQIKPLDFKGQLQRASGKYTTDKGDVAVAWQQDESTYLLKVTIPVNISAHIAVPKGNGQSGQLSINGNKIDATINGDYLEIPNLGSGTYTIIRSL